MQRPNAVLRPAALAWPDRVHVHAHKQGRLVGREEFLRMQMSARGRH